MIAPGRVYPAPYSPTMIFVRLMFVSIESQGLVSCLMSSLNTVVAIRLADLELRERDLAAAIRAQEAVPPKLAAAKERFGVAERQAAQCYRDKR